MAAAVAGGGVSATSFEGAAAGGSEDGSGKVERATAAYTPQYARFVVRNRSYTQQYSHIYSKRISQLRPLALAAAHAKWEALATSCRECHKVVDLRPDASVEWLVVGCVYKDQPLKPSILDEYRCAAPVPLLSL